MNLNFDESEQPSPDELFRELITGMKMCEEIAHLLPDPFIAQTLNSLLTAIGHYAEQEMAIVLCKWTQKKASESTSTAPAYSNVLALSFAQN